MQKTNKNEERAGERGVSTCCAYAINSKEFRKSFLMSRLTIGSLEAGGNDPRQKVGALKNQQWSRP